MRDIPGDDTAATTGLGPVIAALTAPGGEFELVDDDVRGVAMRVYRRGPHTLAELWAATAAWPERTFTVHHGGRRTYGEHRSLVADLAGVLTGRFGLRPGDRVAIAMRNLPEWPAVFFAATGRGPGRRAAERLVERTRAGVGGGRLRCGVVVGPTRNGAPPCAVGAAPGCRSYGSAGAARPRPVR
ncbi:AMP-binding protein [Pseudonocardia sp. ICBG162]|uniref:AMP-binding protein n=1 Tax=Pseudonocardia sp. ICBG162 TaxID=2846761 RepID=UPI001CF6F2BD|nr:AMP-binding protein [Pseudonocardia sp. ICBG162]